MTLDMNRVVSIPAAEVARIRQAAASPADERTLPACCPGCGRFAQLTPLELVQGCPECREFSDGEYRVLLQAPEPGGLVGDVRAAPAEWAEAQGQRPE